MENLENHFFKKSSGNHGKPGKSQTLKKSE